MVNFALEMNCDCVKLIDWDYFSSSFAIDDNDCTNLLSNTVEMMKKYNKSLIIFDLDSIAGMVKQYNSF